jgi:serine/threonine-protein phosphatase 2B catalytic subunit
LSRFVEPPKEGPFCDLLWADPCENDDEAVATEWLDNTTRGCSYVFGAKAATPFLNKNDFLSIIRAHEAQLDG